MTPFRFAVLMTICLAWGFHFTVIKVSVGDIPPLFYVAIRMSIVTLVLLPWLKWHHGKMGTIFLAGLGLGSLNYAFMFSGLERTSASLGAIMIETYVPLAMIFSVIFLGERIGRWRITGATLAFFGVLVIVTEGDAIFTTQLAYLGAFLVFCAAICEAFGAITVKRLTGVKPFELLAWFGIIGAVITGILSLIFEDGQLDFISQDNRLLLLGALLYSVFAASIFGHASYYWLLQRVPVSQVAGATVMTTVFAVTFGVTLLGEPLTVRFLIGALVTLIGVMIIVVRSNPKEKTDQNQMPPAIEKGTLAHADAPSRD